MNFPSKYRALTCQNFAQGLYPIQVQTEHWPRPRPTSSSSPQSRAPAVAAVLNCGRSLSAMIRRPDHSLSQTPATTFHLRGGGAAATAAVVVAAPCVVAAPQLLSLDARKQKAKLSLESERERIVSQRRTNILQEAGHAVSQEAGHAVSALLFLRVRKLDKPLLFRHTNSFKFRERGKEGGGAAGGVGGGRERGGGGDPGGEGEGDHVRLAEDYNNVTNVSGSGHGNRPDVPQRFAKHISFVSHVSQELEMARDTHYVTVSPSDDVILPLSLSLSLSLWRDEQ